MKERRSPTPAAVRKRRAIRRLQQAMEEQRLCLHYQPIVDARTSRADRVEALLRWREPPPDSETLSELIWAAERSPVIFRLENWVMRQAFHDAARWPGEGLSGVRVNVNLSAREFLRADLVRRLGRLLEEAGLPAARVALEITETSRMSDFPAVAAHLERLGGMGMELWLDDFGTGHSSLEWLSHLPLHGLKVAGTFVDRLFSEPRCQAIVCRLADLTRDLGLRTIAEGVEREEQRAFLLECGCDLQQGFLLYAPVPAAELPRLLAPPSPAPLK
jgi:EAL domain-containing protein (putative c-di-GMP-specific phosphodiesterase class I)